MQKSDDPVPRLPVRLTTTNRLNIRPTHGAGARRPGAVATSSRSSRKVHTLVNLKVYDALAALESDAPATKRYPTKVGMPSTSAQPTSAFGSNGSVSAGSPYFIR